MSDKTNLPKYKIGQSVYYVIDQSTKNAIHRNYTIYLSHGISFINRFNEKWYYQVNDSIYAVLEECIFESEIDAAEFILFVLTSNGTIKAT